MHAIMERVVSFSFAYAQLRFLGFSFGLSFIQESYFTVNTDYLNLLVYFLAFLFYYDDK